MTFSAAPVYGVGPVGLAGVVPLPDATGAWLAGTDGAIAGGVTAETGAVTVQPPGHEAMVMVDGCDTVVVIWLVLGP